MEETSTYRLRTDPGELLYPGLGITSTVTPENPTPELLVTINELEVRMLEDPEVTLGFSVTTGAYPLYFTSESTIVGFSPMVNPTGEASGSLTLGTGDQLDFETIH